MIPRLFSGLLLAALLLTLNACKRPEPQVPAPLPLPNVAGGTAAAMDVPTGYRVSTFRVTGMHCDGCAQAIDGRLQEMDGVADQSVSFARSEMVVSYDPTRVSTDALVKVVTDMTYQAEEVRPEPAPADASVDSPDTVDTAVTPTP